MINVSNCELIGQMEVAPGVVRALFKSPEIACQAKPGQFVNINIAPTTTDPLLRRPFSVHATYPEEGVFSVLYVLVGRGTALLSKMPDGSKISIVGPLGRGFDIGDSPDAEHVAVAGGCGAAPLHFLCDAICDEWGCDKTTVLSGAKDKNAVLCEAEFKAHGVEVGISTDNGSYGYHGLVTELLKKHLAESKHPEKIRVYSCGPHVMMREVARISAEAGVSICQVSLENNMSCAMGVCMGCVQKVKGAPASDKSGENWHYERVCKDGPVFNAEDIVWE